MMEINENFEKIPSNEHVLEVFEALDTVAEDLQELTQLKNELLEGTQSEDDQAIIEEEVAKDKELIDQRRDHVLKSVLGKEAISRSDLYSATAEYTHQFTLPEDREAAARRAQDYSNLLEYIQYKGFINLPTREDKEEDDSTSSASGERVRLHGQKDSKTGGTWCSLGDPRTVERIDRNPYVSERVIGTYNVEKTSVDDNGDKIVVAASQGHDRPDFTVNIEPGDRAWRINDDGRLELFIPGNTRPFIESDLDLIEDKLESRDEATRIAVQATKANTPNIINSFEYPSDDVSPIPVPVAKRM